MKYKNYLLNLIAIMTMETICVGVASCGDDDDDPMTEIPNNGEQDTSSGEKNSIQVITGEATAITENSATLSGVVSIKKGKADVMGLLLGDSNNLTISNNSKNIIVDESTASFTKTISELTPNTTYYYRAYSLFENKYYYGEVKSFTTEKEKEALVKITLVNKDGMSLKVKYEPSAEVDYYYCGKGASIRETTKYKETKTLNYNELKPGQEYTFTVIAYTKDGKKNDPISVEFSTASSPYTNYLCFDGAFYQFTSAKTSVEYDYTSVNNTGANWKYLYLYISNYEFVKFYQGVHQWESVSSTWSTGTYNIENSSSYNTYNGFYYDGSRYHHFYDGKMTIKKQNGLTIIDFDCESDRGGMFIGHIEAN